ncbi:MAG: bifunctional DNA primase/polymerase, partial [Nitrososphaeraceae archaeon]
PADTTNKKPLVQWLQYQDSPVLEAQHEQWKRDNTFNKGMAIVAGKVWHNSEKKGLYLAFIDLDNQKAIDEFCTRNGVKTPLVQLAKRMIVEQHSDDLTRAHVYCYSSHPFTKKSSDTVKNETSPAFEVKGSGEHGIAYCSPSVHKNGSSYEIIGTREPETLDVLEGHIDSICKKYGIPYVSNGGIKTQDSTKELFTADTKIYEGHNRHEALLRVMDSLIQRNKDVLTEDQIKSLSENWNQEHCIPALEESEFEKQWKYAVKFIDKKNNENTQQDNEPEISQEEWRSTLVVRYWNLYHIIKDRMPILWDSLEFELSVLRILNISKCTLPFAGIVLGSPSSSKTLGMEMLRNRPNVKYSDNFSAKSFVSHSANVKKEGLKDIDLLPKIKNKALLTPELSPTFTKKDDDLQEVLGIMIRILDGKGYTSDSGVHGERGYTGEHMFVWIGAAVDIPYRVHKILGNLGAKLYFLRIPKSTKSKNDYFVQALADNYTNDMEAIETALKEYLDWFERGPELKSENGLKKIEWNNEKNEEKAIKIITELAILLAHLRGTVTVWDTDGTQGMNYGYSTPIIEEPDRAITQLRNLARGHALSKGRNYITIDDVPLLIKVVLSTASIERVTIFDLLIKSNGILTTTEKLE